MSFFIIKKVKNGKILIMIKVINLIILKTIYTNGYI